MSPKRYHAFISHNSKDKDKITELVKGLQRSGFKVWFDITDIVPGENWKKQVLNKLKDSAVCVVFFSGNGWGKYHLDEVKMALAISDIKIIPAFLSGAPDHTILTKIFFEHSGIPEETTSLDFRKDEDDALHLLKKAIKGESRGLGWSVKLEHDAQNWKDGKQPTYSGKTLREAKDWEKKNPSEVSETGREFINASLTAQKVSRRQIIGGLLFAFLCITCLALYALIQQNSAVASKAGESNQINTAQAANTQAIIAQLTSDAENIRANNEAEEALVNRLSKQVQLSLADTGPNTISKSLLSIEAVRIKLKPEVMQTIHSILSLLPNPVYSKNINYAFPTSISTDGKYVAFWDFNNKIIYIQETETGEEVTQIKNVNNWGEIAFSPSNERIAFGDDKGKLHIFIISTGEEEISVDLGRRIGFIEFSPDGNKVISRNYENYTITITDVNTGNDITLQSHNEKISSTVFNHNGKQVISCSLDKIIRVSDVATGKVIFQEQTNEGLFSCMFSPNDELIAALNAKGVIQVWDIAKGGEIAKMDYTSLVRSFDFSIDSQNIVFATIEGEIQIWNISTSNISSLAKPSDAIQEVRFSPDGNKIISIGYDFTVRTWDTATGREISRMSFDYEVSDIVISPDSKRVVSYNNNGNGNASINIWDIIPEPEALPIFNEGWISDISPNGRMLISDKAANTGSVWELHSGIEIAKINRPGSFYGIKINSDGSLVVSGSSDGTIRVSNATTGEKISDMLSTSSIYELAFSPDNQLIVSGNADGLVQVWEIFTGKEVFHWVHGNPNRISCVSFSSNGEFVVSHNDFFATTQVWNVSTEKEVFNSETSGQLQCATFSPSRDWIISSENLSNDTNSVGIWDITSGEQVAKLKHNDDVNVATFSPDGRWIATGSDDNTSRLWSADTWNEIFRTLNERPVDIISFSSDSKLVAFADESNTIRVFEDSGLEVSRIKPDSPITYLAISPKNDWVISSHQDGIIHVWLLSPDSLITELCSRLPRNLTHLEWQQYFNDEPYRATCPNLPIPTE